MADRESVKREKWAARAALAKISPEERAAKMAEKAAKCAAERAEGLVVRAREAKGQRDGAGVQRLCSAALVLVPGHVEALALLETANPHGWSCQCEPCRKGFLPFGGAAMNPRPRLTDAEILKLVEAKNDLAARMQAAEAAARKADAARAAAEQAASEERERVVAELVALRIELDRQKLAIGSPVEDAPADFAAKPKKEGA